MEPSGRNWSLPVANGTTAKPAQTGETVAVGCDQLPKSFHGKGALPLRKGGVASLAPQEARSPANPKPTGLDAVTFPDRDPTVKHVRFGPIML
jgi:hypothetical protein